MTDNAVTDGDLRNARLWAEKVGPPYTSPNYIGTPSEIYNVARVILDTVDAQLLSEDLAQVTKYWETWPTETITDALTAATDLAKQMEHDLTEARAEVEGINFEKEVREAINDHYDRYAAQERAESPNPADVKPGEAWVVECRGERRNAVKDNDDLNEPWNTVNADGWLLAEDDEDITPITRLVPAPRVITNTDELERAKRCTIILDSVGVVCERASLGDGWFTTQHGTDQTPYIEFPVTVLWEPEEEA